jgi:DNA polymerase III subunit epsilon
VPSGVLRDKPVFARIGQAFLDFIGDAQLVIHNAAFDMKFLNAELERWACPACPMRAHGHADDRAGTKFPARPPRSMRCAAASASTTRREKHGALLDSEILAEVYLELIGGRQPDLVLAPAAARRAGPAGGITWRPRPRPEPLPPRLTEERPPPMPP